MAVSRKANIDRVRKEKPGETPIDRDYVNAYFDTRPEAYEDRESVQTYLFRTFQNFMELFGMVTTDWRFDREKHESFLLIYPTPLFDRMVYIDENVDRMTVKNGDGMDDFGDNWEHTIELEESLTTDEGMDYRVLLDGERRCPPEDCGGVHGYHEMLRILNDPENPERVEYLIWLGGPYDPGRYQVPIDTFRFRVEPDL
jgi:hypothetical protein